MTPEQRAAIVEALNLVFDNIKTINEILHNMADRLDDIDVWRLSVDRKFEELTTRKV